MLCPEQETVIGCHSYDDSANIKHVHREQETVIGCHSYDDRANIKHVHRQKFKRLVHAIAALHLRL